ncbi:DUF2062 domain-containing protein [Geomonas sp.]|uniref:DUF2062 domain-containing protein n=1 Tax=Geomonas sp. TaxID=2651584 RepID=UPI002B475838|nr:DUF2062 domain-containing protein [Geomonas sp.]HJV36617.1 DUF2062 domain-containing protein [Geomonas sp.]
MLNKALWKKRIYAILSLDSHPAHIAAGFAVGVFISFTPFFGLHTPIAIAAAFIFRLNKLTCVTGAWVNTPITVVPALTVSYKLGRFLRGRPVNELPLQTLKALEGGGDWHNLEKYAKSLLLGSSIIGFFAAIIAYFVCYYLVLKFRASDSTQAELAREMEEVGEELE